MPTVNPAVLSWEGDVSRATLDDKFSAIEVVWTQIWEVTATPDATLVDVYFAPNLPKAGELFPGTASSFAKIAGIKRVNVQLWRVTIEYDGKIDRDGGQNNSNPFASAPWNSRAEVEWSTIAEEEEIDTDVDGDPIRTPAGEPIRGLTNVFVDAVATIRKIVQTFDPDEIEEWTKSTNDDVFLSRPAGACKITDMKAKEINSGVTGGYWILDLQVRCRKPRTSDVAPGDVWKKRIARKGIRFKGQAGGNADLTLADGEPVYLKANGTRLGDNDPVEYDYIEVLTPKDYSQLGLGL